MFNLGKSFLICLLLFSCIGKGQGYRSDPGHQLCSAELAALGITEIVSTPIKLPKTTAEMKAFISQELTQMELGKDPKFLYVCDWGGCVISSAKIQLALRAKGITNRRYIVNQPMSIEVDGKHLPNNQFHYFLLVEPRDPKSEPVIIDGTYLQFLEPEARAGLPLEFVGTRQELVDFFTRFAPQIQQSSWQKTKGEKVDPNDFVNRSWGFDASSRYRQPSQVYWDGN